MYSAPLKHVLLGQRVAPYLASKSLLNERSGLSFVADDMSACVKGHTTNFDGDANGLFTYTSPSTKYVTNSAGVLVPGTTMRCDHDASGNKLGLLIEEQRTNLLLRSAEFDNASWTKTNTTVTADQVAAPDGTVSADKIEASSTTSEMRQDATVTGTSATLFAFFKKGSSATAMNILAIRSQTGGTTLLAASINLDTGAITYITGSSGAVAIDWGNGWWLFYMTATITSGHTIRSSVGNNGSAIASGAFSYIWGAQLEAGAFPTSYIPTAGSQVTRAADAITLATSKFPLGAAHTLLLKLRSLRSTVTSLTQMCNLWDGSINERFGNYMNAGTARLVVADGGVTQADMNSNVTVNNGNLHRIAWAADTNDVALVVNGGAAVTDTSATMPTPTTLTLSAATSYHLTELRYRPRRVPNAQLQVETA